MKYIAAYNLALLARAEPTLENVSAILKASEVSFDVAQLKSFLASVEGKTAHELIAAGSKKMEKVGGSAAAAPAATGAAAPAAAAAAAPVVEEEEAAIEFDLF